MNEQQAAAWTFTLAVVFGLAMIVSAGCTIAPAYVEADRATFEAVAPEYRAYVEADSTLEQGQKDRRGRTVDSWNARIREEEGK